MQNPMNLAWIFTWNQYQTATGALPPSLNRRVQSHPLTVIGIREESISSSGGNHRKFAEPQITPASHALRQAHGWLGVIVGDD